MDTKKQIEDALRAIGKDRKWLADQSGYSYFSVRDCLAPEGKKLSKRMHANFMAAIQAQQSASEEPPQPNLPDRITLEVAPEKYELWDQAATDARLTTKQWAIHELNRAAREWQEEQRLRSLSLVAEEPATYHTDTTKKA